MVKGFGTFCKTVPGILPRHFIFNQPTYQSKGLPCVFLLAAMAHGHAPAFRLPKDVLPRHYDLDIITHLEPNNYIFQGNVAMKVDCVKSTDMIKVHARDLSFPDAKVWVKTAVGEAVALAGTQQDKENEFFVVKTQQPLAAGKSYLLNLGFQGNLTEDLIGYYRSSYVDKATNTKKWLTITHFEPSDARQAFPCFDEPTFKATFTIRLAHTDNYISISNMPLKSTTPFEGRPGWVWDEFETSVPISTYLVAYMVSEYKCRLCEPQARVQFRVCARPDAMDQTDFACMIGPKFLAFYEDLFDFKYPLPKQDLLAIPDFKIGAMENWGIITFREARLLLDEKTTSSTSKLHIANIVAHEIAHMWFGNLVTMHWWTDLWLKEGFATYMASLCVHHTFPEWNELDNGAMSDLLNVFDIDSLKSSHPVSVPIHHPREISQIFDAISYDKGSFLLRMISLFLGEEVFRHGISEYLKNHQFSTAEQDDLWHSLTEQAHRYHTLPPEMSVKQVMDTWTLQTGYPIITTVRDYDNHKVTVSQRRYLAVKSSVEADYAGRWWVPLSYSTAQEPLFKTQPQHWLSNDSASAVLDIPADKDQWFILNNRCAGLYRVNYDSQNWALLINTLNSPQFTSIDVMNRALLVADCLDLADLGVLSYQTALDLLQYLRQERSILPWEAALTKLEPLDSKLSRTPNYGLFKKFMQKLMTPLVSSLRLTAEPQSLEEGRLLSLMTVWGARLGVADCGAQAGQLYQQWRACSDPDTHNPIPRDVRKTVYTHAVREGGEAVWQWLWERYKQANISTEKSNILYALSAARDPWLLNRYLEWTLDDRSGIKKQDAFIIFSLTAQQETGFYIAQKFFFKNIKKISDYYGGKSVLMSKYFSAIAKELIHPYELQELKDFTEANKELLAPASLAIPQALESVQMNINWMKEHYETWSVQH